MTTLSINLTLTNKRRARNSIYTRKLRVFTLVFRRKFSGGGNRFAFAKRARDNTRVFRVLTLFFELEQSAKIETYLRLKDIELQRLSKQEKVFMKILIGYDGSESADVVFADLKKAGLPFDTEAVIVSVGDLLMSSPSVQEAVVAAVSSRRVASGIKQAQTHAAKVIKEAQEFAANGKKRLSELFPDWRVRSEIFTGTPAWVLIDAADKLNTDLIVVGSQGRSAIGRLFLGSVSKKIATDAGCSVRVSRGGFENNENAPPRIIVGVDGSPAAEQAIYAVGQRVWQDGTEVRFVTVDDAAPPTRIAARLPQAAAMINSYFQTRASRVSAMLEWATEEFKNINLKTSILREKGDPKTVLLAEAENWNADSIFVGTRDIKSAFERFRLGSVSTAVVTNANCSVEIVRPPETIVEQFD